MKLELIKKRAKELGIKTDGLTKKELINTIQIYEGNYPCFGSAIDFCDRSDCCWREDCLNRQE